VQPVILVRIGYGYIVVRIGREFICILIFGKAELSKSINYFLNINSGRKSGKGWHHDNPIEGTKVTGKNSCRFIGYIMQDARVREPIRTLL
jgi:hypothetical protein